VLLLRKKQAIRSVNELLSLHRGHSNSDALYKLFNDEATAEEYKRVFQGKQAATHSDVETQDTTKQETQAIQAYNDTDIDTELSTFLHQYSLKPSGEKFSSRVAALGLGDNSGFALFRSVQVLAAHTGCN